jgi:CarD family transcriptional regulator
MEFRAGDDVVHPAHGVGSVLRHEERQMSDGAACHYYVLAIGPTTVWVPVRPDGSTNLRAVTARNELDQYRAILKSRPAALDRDHNKRRAEINARLALGSFRAMCEVLRDLTALGWSRRIGDADAAMLHKVRDNLGREWAAASGLSLPETLSEIDALLQTGQKIHQPKTAVAQ